MLPLAQRTGRFSLLLLAAILQLTSLIHSTHAASFSFALSTPIQCSNLTVTVSGGTPPYQLIIIPVGSVTPETRRIINRNITGGKTTDSFELAYPAGSQFVALMNDATGIDAGGTSIATTVAASNDKSCLTPTISPPFYFYMSPVGYLSQCQTTQLSWDTVAPNNAQGQVTFYAIIPGGETFVVTPPSQPYNWQVNVRAGTTITLFAGDSRGIGTGGSAGPFIVNGTDDSCINAQSPSSTAGSPAGAVTAAPGGGSSTSTPTTTTFTSGSSVITTTASSGAGGSGGSGSSNSSHSTSHTGAIVGGVVGGLAGLAILAGLLFFFCIRRRRRQREVSDPAHRTVDLAEGDDTESHTPGGAPPMIEAGFYHPEPFVVPEISSSRPSTDINHAGGRRPSFDTDVGAATAAGAGAGAAAGGLRERRYSQNTLSTSSPGATSAAATGSAAAARRGGGGGGGGDKRYPPSAMRATNFVQHEDGGPIVPPPSADEGEGQTTIGPNGEELVELPPTYSTLRPRGRHGQGHSHTGRAVVNADTAASEGGHTGEGDAEGVTTES